ncbi:MAG: class I SAM-dependent methyltransferase [Sterolibacterium sp.]
MADTEHDAVRFFESQFRRQVESGDFALNPFEQLALGYAKGTLLDLGCGLGNLALAAARRGCRVTALDASGTAIDHLRVAALKEGLPIEASLADLSNWSDSRKFDTVVAIGLLMFFPRDRALSLLDSLRDGVAPGGCCIVNVLVEGTTYLDMFEPAHFHLFTTAELEATFGGWRIHVKQRDGFDAPGGSRKEFLTIVAQCPGKAS